MTAVLLGVIVLLLVALPLLAMAAGRWLPRPKGRPGPLDPTYAFVREHHLTGTDIYTVQDVVKNGREAPHRLRAVTVDYARYVLTFDVLGRPPDPSRRRVGPRTRYSLISGYLVLLVIVAIYVAREGEITYLGVQSAFYVVIAAIAIPLQRRNHRLRRAAALQAITANDT